MRLNYTNTNDICFMKKLPFILLCGIALLTTACVSPSTTENAPEHIIGSWTVRAIDSIMLSDENVSYPVITFREEGRVDATAGCNTIGGECTYAAATLTFSDNLCQTLMFCPDEEMSRNEQLLTQAMDSVLSVATCGKDSLRLEGKHSMLLVKIP